MDEHEENPLLKEVSSHLLQFEEKIFGMTLTQLLCDIGAGLGILMLASSLPVPLPARIAIGILLALPALILVHASIRGQSVPQWLFLYVRFLFLPKFATWQPLRPPGAGRRKRGQPVAVQDTWIEADSLEGHIMGFSEPGGKRGGPRGRYWMVFEVEGRNIRYLPRQDQVRVFGRFERFLAGLSFRLQFISQVERIQPESYQPLLDQRNRQKRVAGIFPILARLLQASIDYQYEQLGSCTTTRYFVVISVNAREEAARVAADGSTRSQFMLLLDRLLFKKLPTVSRKQLFDQLNIRASLLKKLFSELEVRAWPLKDAELLRVFASCLVPGAAIPSFAPEVQAKESAKPAVQLSEQAEIDQKNGVETPEVKHHATRDKQAALPGSLRQRPGYAKRVRGLHATLLYRSKHQERRFEWGALRLADLLAPTSIQVLPDEMVSTVKGRAHYRRSFAVTGYGHDLLCGTIGGLCELGLPMTIVNQFDTIDTAFMINKLEGQRLKLKSKRHADNRVQRDARTSQEVEENQVQRALRILGSQRSGVHPVSLLVTLHASSREHLEERSHYLLSHLRQRRLRVRPMARRHDECMQLSLPTCMPVPLDLTFNMLSPEASALLHCTNGVIGTPTGAFLGFSESGLSRRPVYLNPWSEEQRNKVSNPHILIISQTGGGKSWVCKQVVTGLMGLGIADVVVLDKDNDYSKLAEFLQDECQVYDLARGCPVNMFDICYGPADIDPDNPQDLLTEFLENSLLPALSLLVCKAGNELDTIEEAYLMHVGRATYAHAGITSEAIMSCPDTLLKPAPTLSDFIATMQETPASSASMKQSLLERLERARYLFSGRTSISLEKPLTVFSIHELKEDWYPIATYVVQNFLMRHRSLRRDERYLAYVVEEASYMLKHPAGRKYLETGSRGFRKLGIAQITISQNPEEFLEEGKVVLNNAGTVFYLGMQESAAQKLQLAPDLEDLIKHAEPGQAVMRCGNEYAQLSVAAIPQYRTLFTTDERDRREEYSKLKQQHPSSSEYQPEQAIAS